MFKTKHNYIEYTLVFFIGTVVSFVILHLLTFRNFYGDPINNYGFSYAIVNGQIPYKDFNIITTPLYSFVMSLGLLLWNNSLMFLIEHSILIGIFFLIIYKMYGIKSFAFFPIIMITRGLMINPTYNFFLLLLLILLVFLETEHSDKDYMIGFVLALSVLTKQSIGIFFIIPTILYYYNDKNKLKKRIIGFIIPMIIFGSYLLITNSYREFFDLCFMGLLDFGSKNGVYFNYEFFLSLLLLTMDFLYLNKYKNISNLYYILSFFFLVPIFDSHHLSYFVFCSILIIISSITKYDRLICITSIISFIIISICSLNSIYNNDKIVLNKKIKKFEYLYDYKTINKEIEKTFDYFDKVDNKIILSRYNMYYDISRNNKIDYYDILNQGNFGLNGKKKIIDNIDNRNNIYIIIHENDYENKCKDNQYDKELIEYIDNNYELVDKKHHHFIYYKK